MISMRKDSVRGDFDACIRRNVCLLKAGADARDVCQRVSACSGDNDR